MAGLYIHFPYCEKKCLYCDFYSEVINHADILPFLKALKQEVALRSNSPDLEPKQIKTLYFGGGTPSLLTYDQMEDLLETVIFNFMIKPQSEITIEVNPGTLSKEKLKHLYQMGFNRMSIGIQSFNREELRFLGRIHSPKEGVEAIQMARNGGFENVGIDLIFGFPDQNFKIWKQTLKKAVSMETSHISVYSLTWKNQSPLGKMIQNHLLPQPDENGVAEMYLWAAEFLEKNGFDHYEISNFAKPGYRCQHNETYWTGHNYLGFGPSAHSYIDNNRFWNISSVNHYIKTLAQNELPVEDTESLNQKQRSLEQLMLGLRKAEGIPLKTIKNKKKTISKLIKSNLAKCQHGYLALSNKGFLLADEIALQLS